MPIIQDAIQIRTFVPAKNFSEEKQFYVDIGFKIGYDAVDLCVMHSGSFSFYLQDYYVKEWAENFMMFMELSNADETYNTFKSLDLINKYKNVKLIKPVDEHWGRVFRIITPTGVLWHFGAFPKDQILQ